MLRLLHRPRLALSVAAAMAGLGTGAALAVSGPGSAPEPPVRTATRTVPPVEPGEFDLRPRPRAVRIEGVAPPPRSLSPRDDAPSPGARSDAQVRAELAQLESFKRHLSGAHLTTGPRARILPDGTAVAPFDAPEVVKRVILAGNEIAKFPYKWGGGHGTWRDTGYDCSGSVSFALAGAGLLDRPLASGGFMRWGAEGDGEWITIYANPGHMFMVVAGLRFDTSGRGRAGTRWQAAPRSASGYAVRHPPGL